MRRIAAALLTTVAVSTGFLGCSDDSDAGAGGTSTSDGAGAGSDGAGSAGNGGSGDGGSGDGGPGDGGSGSGDGGSSAHSGAGGGDGGSGDGGSGDGGSGEARGLGARCAKDADCGPRGHCFTESGDDLFGGGPAGGYCTTACEQDSDCEGEGSACFGGLCFLGCAAGEPPLMSIVDKLDPAKCRGREELRCEDIDDVYVCLPNCGSDSQCGGDRVCDPRMNVCVDEPTRGLPTGAQCAIKADGTDPCAGWCIEVGTNLGVCAGLCGLGGDIANEDCGGLEKGLCAYPFADEPGVGDVGMCTNACTSHSDCLLPTSSCVFLGVETNGFCLFGVTKCPRGQSSCADGEVCTLTPKGRLCLDENYPLEDPGTGGAGGGGGAGGMGGADAASSTSGAGGAGGAGAASGAGGADAASSTSGAGGADAASSTSGAGGADAASSTSGAGGADAASSTSGAGGTDAASSTSGAGGTDAASSTSGAGGAGGTDAAGGAGGTHGAGGTDGIGGTDASGGAGGSLDGSSVSAGGAE
ncbi:hypothetical protein [Sorangium atrum]|uniref:PE-PGRS family protein n=1 Tax=Sorangium atrum TaxID=2995308 RepID=A0ABT5CGE4_9BACT|nr:hypothetical protein [Sorangium aterium]MDC0685504.1 hypothetical protein [Sorangium aterium]